jgi:hypothetical protein
MLEISCNFPFAFEILVLWRVRLPHSETRSGKGVNDVILRRMERTENGFMRSETTGQRVSEKEGT